MTEATPAPAHVPAVPDSYDALIATINAMPSNLGEMPTEKAVELGAAIARLANRNRPIPPNSNITLMGVG